MGSSCLICERLALVREDKNPYVIAEFKHSIFVVGDHQFFKGYSLVLYKEHVRELHELPADVQSELFAEVMVATRALVAAYQPWKMNHACYGNADEHIHWHILPRYADDPDRIRPPFLHGSEFKNHLIDTQTAAETAAFIRKQL
jgi:diadenosine tetraphosphate (Ap4A) HIT family hydrolase